VVYGISTDETDMAPELRTSFHYDHVFGTVLNRFLVQAATDEPLTVYGNGSQTRGFLNIRDTIQCVELAADTPADRGDFRIFNQFTEQFSVKQLADMVQATAKRAGVDARIENTPNPRVEQEDHYYNAKHTGLLELGLKPHLLDDAALDGMFAEVQANCDRVNADLLPPTIAWARNEK
jgi:UDP-sulfoquinovose synthase